MTKELSSWDGVSHRMASYCTSSMLESLSTGLNQGIHCTGTPHKLIMDWELDPMSCVSGVHAHHDDAHDEYMRSACAS